MFPSLYETGEHRTLFLKKGPMFPAFPKKGPMFPDMYVTWEHRTLFKKKKSSMLPGLLLFPPLLPNSGRDNYHCMSLSFVEEGETSENLTQSIHTPVNKPREAQSLRELPALRPSGGAQSFWPWYYYTIILHYILSYKELWESQTATITLSSMLQFTPDCTALSWPVERWLAVTLHMSLSGHAVERRLAVITRMTRQSLNIFIDW